MSEWQGTAVAVVADHRVQVHGWRRWAPRAAVAWSLAYAALGVYWAVSGRGFPYTSSAVSDPIGPMLGRFPPAVAWIVVMMAGAPAAAMGAAMLRGARSGTLRPLFIAAGGVLALVLLLFMTGLHVLIMFGYVPFIVRTVLTGGGVPRGYVNGLIEWTFLHQLLCLAGGFLWLAATVCYGHRSGDACVYCGRRDGPEGWQSPERAARWTRIAVYVSMIAPLFYAFTRYGWALGFPLGMSEEALRRGQERGTWIAGLFLANFGLAGAALTLGLMQRWGEAFPRWMIGLARRRVPIALAVVPASFVSVLLVVGGIVIWSALDSMVWSLAVRGGTRIGIVHELFFAVGPTLLFPVWGAAVAVAAVGYYYRRRGACGVCGRGASESSTPCLLPREADGLVC